MKPIGALGRYTLRIAYSPPTRAIQHHGPGAALFPPLDARRAYFLLKPTKEGIMSRIAKIILTIAGAAALAACNTVAGIGRDVESVGETVEDAAT
jgi:predicted small secreted protein